MKNRANKILQSKFNVYKLMRRILLSRTLMDLVFILVIACFPFIRVGLDGIIDQGDMDFPLYPQEFLSRMSYAWDEFAVYFGVFSFVKTSHIPFYIFPAFLSFTGMPINLVNRITLITYFSFVGWSAYFMIRILVSECHRYAPILSAVFYMYNPYMIGEIWLGHWYSLLSFAVFPLLIIGVTRALSRENQCKKWSLLISLLSPLVIPRVRLFPIVLGFLILYLLVFLFTNRTLKYIMRILKIVLISCVSSIILNLVWILPILADLETMYKNLFFSYNALSVGFPPTFSNIFNILNLVGYGITTDPNSPGRFFESEFAKCSGILIVILSYLAFFLKRKNFFVRFFTLTSLLFNFHMITFTKSTLYRKNYILLIKILPPPFNYFLPKDLAYLSLPVSLSYAFLLGITFNELAQRSSLYVFKVIIHLPKIIVVNIIASKSFWSKVLGSFLFFITLFNSSPLFIGTINDPITPANIPKYYDDARLWLEKQNENFKIFLLPPPPYLTYQWYKWSRSIHPLTDILPHVFPVPIVTAYPKGSYQLGKEIVELAYTSFPSISFKKILQLMSVKYVLLRTDTIDNDPYYESVLKNLGFNIEKKIGHLHFYRNTIYAPIIYASPGGIPFFGDEKALIPFTYINDLQFNHACFFWLDKIGEQEVLFLVNQTKTVFLFKPPSEDLLNTLKKMNVRFIYVFHGASPRYVKIAKGGLYKFLTVSPSQSINEERIFNFSDGELVYSPHFDTSLPSNSIEVLGTSVETDKIAVTKHESLFNTEIEWTLDVNKPKFHTLFIGLNEWELESLASKDGGISMEIYGDGSGEELRFSFMVSNERYFRWPLQTLYVNWTGWKEITLPLNNFESIDAPEWDNVRQLWIWYDVEPNAQDNITIRIRKISRFLGSYTTFLIPIRSYEEDVPKILSISDQKIKLEVVKINPVSFVAKVQSNTSFFLVLNEAYDPGWKAYANGRELRHFIVNSYANGYYVSDSGEFIIKIVFSPYKFFLMGAYISLGALIIILIYLMRNIKCVNFFLKRYC